MAEGNPSFGTDGVVALTLQHYMRNLVNQIFRRTILLHLLGGGGEDSISKVKSQTGRSIVQELLYGDQTAVGSFADDDVFAAPSRSGITAAEFQYRNFYGSVFFTGEEMDKNSGPEQAVSLLKARLKQVENTMARNLNAMLWADGTGNGGKDFLGLAALIGSTTNTVGGIDRSDAANAWWRPVRTDHGAAAVSEAALRTLYNDVSDGVEKATHILTTQAGFEAYEALLQGTIRHMDTSLGDAGFDNLMFKSTPMAFDRDATAGTYNFLNLNYLELVSLNGAWFKPSDWLVPTNQDAKYKNIIARGNLTVSHSAYQGQLHNVSDA